MNQTSTQLTDPARLAALAETGLMDSASERVFDRAVRLATRLLGTPVGLLSLVDGQRQFFKAQTGLGQPYSDRRETPLSHSFCQYVVRSGAPLSVRDARHDDRLKTNLAVSELDVIAYLGVPVRDLHGAVLGSFCAIQSTPRDWTDEDREILEDIAAGVESEIATRGLLAERARAARAQEALTERLNLALKAGALGTYDLDLTTGIATWDDELYQIWGLEPGHSNPFDQALTRIHPEDMPAHEAAFAAAMDPQGDGHYGAEMRVIGSDPDDIRWLWSTGLVRFQDGTPIRMVGTVQDISDAKRAQEQTLLLSQELNHRVKNLFAITAGLIGITARESGNRQEMADALRARIVSLSAAHDLVRPAITGDQHAQTSTDLRTLAATILGPHLRGQDQLALDGPELEIAPKTASALALVLHELATNAGKYGALSQPEGRLSLAWRRDAGDLSLTWRETDGPAATTPPSTTGFGSTLLDMTIKRQLFGTYSTDWADEGLTIRLTLPWPPKTG